MFHIRRALSLRGTVSFGWTRAAWQALQVAKRFHFALRLVCRAGRGNEVKSQFFPKSTQPSTVSNAQLVHQVVRMVPPHPAPT